MGTFNAKDLQIALYKFWFYGLICNCAHYEKKKIAKKGQHHACLVWSLGDLQSVFKSLGYSSGVAVSARFSQNYTTKCYLR